MKPKKEHLVWWISGVIIALILSGVACESLMRSESSPTAPDVSGSPQSQDVADIPIEGELPGLARRGALMYVAWPFGPWQLTRDWTGWQGSRTGGASGSYCGGTRPSTHSGAEYYARDLNQRRGLDCGIRTYAGIAGKIVYAGWRNGYGNTVVIYDQNRHVALRYAHLSSIYSGIWVGKVIPAKHYLGRTGRTGTSSCHLHIVGYENINHNNGNPIIPSLCDSEYYCCQINFYWWNY